jgi:flagellar biosynthesis anti-sigma factor FlgM
MKVSGNHTAVQMEAYLKQVQQQKQLSANNDPAAARQSSQADKVDLSYRAREVQQAAQILKQMPAMREEKVQQAKMEVDNGTYKVVGARVATDMLRESFENNLILQKINTRV